MSGMDPRDLRANRRCPRCGILLREDEVLIRKHMDTSHCFECQYCDKSFISVKEIAFHDNNIHLTNKCSYCDKLFREEIHLQEHIAARHSFQCQYCDRFFKSTADVNFHDAFEHRTFTCHYCERRFRSDEQLYNHIDTEHYYECHFCDKTFRTIEEVQFHNNYVHLTIECPHCDRTFRTNSQLEKHLTAKHYYLCQYCEQTFKSMDGVNFHDANVHQTIECPHCDRLFREEEQLQQHMRFKHYFTCQYCNKFFISIEQLNFHDKFNHLVVECPHCDIAFRTVDELEPHMMEKHNFLCQYCSESFLTVKERLFHDRNIHLTFECPECHIYFRSDDCLQEHLLDKHPHLNR